MFTNVPSSAMIDSVSITVDEPLAVDSVPANVFSVPAPVVFDPAPIIVDEPPVVLANAPVSDPDFYAYFLLSFCKFYVVGCQRKILFQLFYRPTAQLLSLVFLMRLLNLLMRPLLKPLINDQKISTDVR